MPRHPLRPGLPDPCIPRPGSRGDPSRQMQRSGARHRCSRRRHRTAAENGRRQAVRGENRSEPVQVTMIPEREPGLEHHRPQAAARSSIGIAPSTAPGSWRSIAWISGVTTDEMNLEPPRGGQAGFPAGAVGQQLVGLHLPCRSHTLWSGRTNRLRYFSCGLNCQSVSRQVLDIVEPEVSPERRRTVVASAPRLPAMQDGVASRHRPPWSAAQPSAGARDNRTPPPGEDRSPGRPPGPAQPRPAPASRARPVPGPGLGPVGRDRGGSRGWHFRQRDHLHLRLGLKQSQNRSNSARSSGLTWMPWTNTWRPRRTLLYQVRSWFQRFWIVWACAI